MDKYIINRHGKLHSVPDALLPVVRASGGRLATDVELAAAGLAALDSASEPASKPKRSKRAK